MPKARKCCMFLLVTLLTGIPSGSTATIYKSVCLEDPVKLFEHVSLANHTIVINHIHGNSFRQIGRWFINGSTIHSSVDQRFERIVSLDKNGTIWIRKVQDADEGKYKLLYEEDTGTVHVREVELNVMVAPSNDCKPSIRLEDTHLIAFLDGNACGRPPASGYLLGYRNLTAIEVQPGKESSPYHACIHGPSLRCARGFKATDFCSSFRRDTVNEELLPKISLVPNNIPDRSIKLQCQFNDRSASKVRWRRNGILINNNAKYNQMNDSLTIRELSNDDKYDIYTCLESDGRFESDPYSIETIGPSFIQLTPSTMIVKENDRLEVVCSTDCYPHCSVEWSKLYLSSGHKQVLSKNYTLTINNVTRQMSGNYLCKVQNLVTGIYFEASLPLNVYYGPDKSLLNTSNSIIEVDEFDSITIVCTAECFPPCLINWTDKNANSLIGYAAMTLVNVSTNASYKCIAKNPATDISTVSQTINIYVKLDETLIPKIGVYRHNVLDFSVVLKCHSFRQHRGRFFWMVNGYLVKHTDRYSPDNDFLSVRHLTAADQNNSYTCTEPVTKFLSDPFWIKASGPTSIRFSPQDLVFKEHIGLNISCLADCFPLCSFHWLKWDESSGQKNIFSEDNALQITNMSREMSGNYSCKVQNIITGAFNESTLSMDVIYGPDEIVLNTSNKIIEVEEFDSITILCTAECFPHCLISWTETYTQNIIRRGADLKLVNVKSDGTYTCHATNPKIANATIIENVVIHVKYDATLTPRVVVVKYNASDASIVLECRSYRTSTGRFSWRVNGSMLVNNDRYSLDNMFLFIRQISDDDQYNALTCIEPRSGFQSDPFSMKTYGPDEIVINNSENETEVYKFGSATFSCSADCFPPCLLRWTFSYRDTVIEGGELAILNVTSNVSLTCHASNPINMNATVSETINITVKSENSRQKESSVDRDMETTIIDIRYLVYAVLSILGIGVIVAVCCLRKKYKHCSHVDIVSNNTTIAHADIDESHHEETLPEHYWTIVTNSRGKFYTALERDINEEPGGLVDPAQSVLMEFDLKTIPRHHHSEELEVYTNSVYSDSIYIDTSFSNSVEREGYINPIPSDPAKCSEDIDPRWSNSVEFNKYLDPNHSDIYAIDIYSDPSSSDSYKDDKSTDGSIPSYPGERDQYTDKVRSDAVKRDTNTDNCHAVNVQSARHSDRIPLDAVEIDSCIVVSKSNAI